MTYQFSEKELRERMDESPHGVMQQMSENSENHVWTNIKNLEKLENIWISAMRFVALAPDERTTG